MLKNWSGTADIGTVMRMRTYLLGIAVLVLAGCGKGITSGENVVIADARITEVIQRFIAEGLARGRADARLAAQVPVTVVEGLSQGGVCHRPAVGRRWIELSDRWLWSNADFQEITLFHELGHCVLNKEHDSREGQIMFLNVVYAMPSYQKNRTSLLDALFEP
jgi:hypothetical protein